MKVDDSVMVFASEWKRWGTCHISICKCPTKSSRQYLQHIDSSDEGNVYNDVFIHWF